MINRLRLFQKDLLGALCSALCVVHCLLPALAIGAGQAGLIGAFGDSEWIHGLLVLISITIIAWVMPSALRIHRNPGPCIVSGLGLCALVAGLLLHEFETALTVLGATAVLIAHGWNSYSLWQVKRVALV